MGKSLGPLTELQHPDYKACQISLLTSEEINWLSLFYVELRWIFTGKKLCLEIVREDSESGFPGFISCLALHSLSSPE